MSHVIVLDTGPLGLLTNPKKSPETRAATQWAITMMAAGRRLVVPAIADYEVRRELERAGKAKGLEHLDALNSAPDRFLSISHGDLRLAAKLWAQARNAGNPTADPKELDADVLIAAQALGIDAPEGSSVVVATTNASHLTQFTAADLWTSITP